MITQPTNRPSYRFIKLIDQPTSPTFSLIETKSSPLSPVPAPLANEQNIVTNIGSTGECKMDEAKIEAEEGDERPAHARILRWGDVEGVKDMMEVLETGHFDLVIGSDLIYPESVSFCSTNVRLDGWFLKPVPQTRPQVDTKGSIILIFSIESSPVLCFGVFTIVKYKVE